MVKRRPSASPKVKSEDDIDGEPLDGEDEAAIANNAAAVKAELNDSSNNDITVMDRRNFEKNLQSEDCPPGIKERWLEIKNLGYGCNKEDKKRQMVRAWRNEGWSAPLFHEVISYTKEAKKEEMQRLLPWGRCVVKFGSQEAAEAALADGDLIAMADPKDASKVKYCMVENKIVKSGNIMKRFQGSVQSEAKADDPHIHMLQHMADDIDHLSFDISAVQAPPPAITSASSSRHNPPSVASPGDSLDGALKKARTALENISKLRLKVSESIHADAPENAKTAQDSLRGKEELLLAMIKKYEQLLILKTIRNAAGQSVPATVSLIKESIKADSKETALVKASVMIFADACRV